MLWKHNSISKPLVYDELTETQQIIWNYYESIAARDWETRQALLYPPIRQNDRSYIDNPENEMNHLGLFNIKDVELVEIHSVDAEKYAYCCADEHIVENIEAYLVGFECETYEDTAFYFTGINYNIATLVEDDGDWYISNTSTAPVECIEESANMWLTGKAIQRIESRCKGSTSGYNILEEQPALRKNATSSALASLSSDLLSDMVLPSNSISSAPTVPDNSNYEPKSIVVYLPYRGSSVTDSFFEYVVRSLKIEYGSKSVNGYRDEQVQEARKAIAVAIKMFAWYAMIHPIHNEYKLMFVII